MELLGLHICPHCIVQGIVIIKDEFMMMVRYIFKR